MKRAFGIVLLVALALAGCQVGAQPTPTPSLAADYVPVVSVTGELIPARRATLSHKVGGKVVEVLVEPGDTVAVGAPLVLLDTSDLELALQRAQEQVASQQAALDLVRAGATERVIARADRDNAHQVAQAESALQAKQQQLAQAQATDPVAELDAAEARVAQVERQIVQARRGHHVLHVAVCPCECAGDRDAGRVGGAVGVRAVDDPSVCEPQPRRGMLRECTQPCDRVVVEYRFDDHDPVPA